MRVVVVFPEVPLPRSATIREDFRRKLPPGAKLLFSILLSPAVNRNVVELFSRYCAAQKCADSVSEPEAQTLTAISGPPSPLKSYIDNKQAEQQFPAGYEWRAKQPRTLLLWNHQDRGCWSTAQIGVPSKGWTNTPIAAAQSVPVVYSRPVCKVLSPFPINTLTVLLPAFCLLLASLV